MIPYRKHNVQYRNAKVVAGIYSNICPIFLWINEMKMDFSKDDQFKNEISFRLLKEMRNMGSHLYFYNYKNIQNLFINLVLVYRKFGMNLVDKFENVREIWNIFNDGLVDCSSFKLGNHTIDYDSISISNQFHYQAHYDSLKKVLSEYFSEDFSLLTYVYKFGSPIIIWNEIIKKEKDENIKKSKLFIITNEIKNKLCHCPILDLSEIEKSIDVIYQSFGLNSINYNSENRNNLYDTRLIKGFYANDIIMDIRKIISEKYNKSRRFYFTFGTLLHHIVARNLLKNNSILRHFEDRKNDLEWDHCRGSFKIKRLEFVAQAFFESSEGLELHFTEDLCTDSSLYEIKKLKAKDPEPIGADHNNSNFIIILKIFFLVLLLIVGSVYFCY